MSTATYVLFSLGTKRFALPAEAVTELARPDILYSFPHTTPLLIGVLVRRGRIVPVCDIAELLVGADAPARRFYLIANRNGTAEWTAIPVTGACELVSADAHPPTGELPEHVVGLLSLGLNDPVEVLDLERILRAGKAEVRA
jgi:chemotaxis signal transduction protein